ncbi:hypothetical protein [Paenibacillus glycanilyticus]|uniref:Lipoprotein n=1 Tax=Paenibacillus glycanilyticus TaxID=126569 RepID=A0ABQ6NH42_9BACL|nr:hypothetical protein [Paenibacillus glycanilyticus]GMK43900.1 hypothetical protein PghCCS26_10270 [Paenibacillus glycanilyticus]
MKSILIVLFSMIMLTVGCQSKQEIINGKLIVYKRIGVENKHQKYIEIKDKEIVQDIYLMLKKEDWVKVMLKMTTPPEYKIHFEPTNGSQALSIEYDVWFTNGFAEVYIEAQNLKKRLPREDSTILYDAIQ